MDKYNVTLYAAVNRYKLREAQNLFFNAINEHKRGTFVKMHK